MINVKVEALDMISHLGQEMVVAYEAEDATVGDIVSALLEFQLRRTNGDPFITKGTIHADYNTLTRSIKVDGDTILRAIYKLQSTVGGYIHVDNDRLLQWENSIGDDTGQQLRYRKNLKGIERDIDFHGLVNRLYAYGAGEGTARIKLSDADGQDEDYVQDQDSHDNWGGWYPGVLVDRSITHPDTLLAWANLRLAEIKVPIISYSVNVIDLSESDLFDFSFDELKLGSIVKVIDEDLGIDASVSVVKITHNDLANPQDMTVELSSRVRDITDVLAEVYDAQQFGQHVATTIGAGQVIVKGEFTVQGWVTEGETTIVGSNIETGTIALNRLDFVPLTSSGTTGQIIATINATAEGGLRIAGDNITLDGDTECTGDFKVQGSIEGGKTLTVNGAISAGGGNVKISSEGIGVKGEQIYFWDVDETKYAQFYIHNITKGFYLTGTAVAVTIDTLNGQINLANPTTCGETLSVNGTLTLIARIDSHLLPHTTATYDLGNSTYKWKDAYIGGRLNIGDGSRPIISETGDIGGSDKWYDKMYANNFYGHLSQTITAFQGHDDVGLLRSIKSNGGHLDPQTFPREISVSEGGFVDMLNWQSLNMGAILQIADRLAELEVRVDALN